MNFVRDTVPADVAPEMVGRRHVGAPVPRQLTVGSGTFVEDDASLATRVRDAPDTCDHTPPSGRSTAHEATDLGFQSPVAESIRPGSWSALLREAGPHFAVRPAAMMTRRCWMVMSSQDGSVFVVHQGPEFGDW